MNKKKIFALIVVLGVIVVIGIAAFSGSSEFDRKVNELKNRRMHERVACACMRARACDYNVQDYPGPFSEAKAERPGVTFVETGDWQSFKNQVVAAMAGLGFVTVYCHEDEGILWVGRSEETIYYYFEVK